MANNLADENFDDQFLFDEYFDDDLRYLDIIIGGCQEPKQQKEPTLITDNEEIFLNDSDDDEIELLLEKIPDKSKKKESETESDIVFVGSSKPISSFISRPNICDNITNFIPHSNQPRSSHDRGYIENYNLLDPRLESLDPTPNIQKLFREFDLKFFDDSIHKQPNFLGVKWCGRLMTAAGIFTVWYNQTSKKTLSHIKLSSKLLSLRPRSDLVETLLHEMIHAYIYFTGIQDDGSHGTRFQNLMHQINMAAGTNVSVYHTFSHEVRYHQSKEKNTKLKKNQLKVTKSKNGKTIVSFSG